MALLFGLWTGYVLAVTGPIASLKYRLPIEPVLAVLTGAGFCLLRDRWLCAPQPRKPLSS